MCGVRGAPASVDIDRRDAKLVAMAGRHVGDDRRRTRRLQRP